MEGVFQMKNYIVYKHTSPSNKVYIGITCQKNYKHRWDNGKGYINNPYFTRAINKYGWDNFKHEILFTDLCELDAKSKETELIAFYDSTNRDKGYNITLGGESTNGYHHTDEAKLQISEKLKGVNTWTSEALKGRTRDGFMTDEIKEKISKSKKGSTPWNKGVKLEGDKLKALLKAHNKPILVYTNFTNEFVMRFESRKDCAEYFNVSDTTIGDCLSGRSKSFLKKQYIARYE